MRSQRATSPGRQCLAVLLALFPHAAGAQPTPPQPGLIERVAPPAPPRLGPPLLPPEPARTTGPGEQRRIPVGRVTVTGNTALPSPPLPALAGREATLAEIESARLGLLRAHREAGFPYVAVGAALAPLPDGTAELRLEVTEGVITDIRLDGEAIGPAARHVLRLLEPLRGRQPLPAAALERALLLAGDIPGLEARGVLRPAQDGPGALQLVVRLARRPVTGFLSLDNRGQPVTGAWQGLLVAQANALTVAGERTELALLGTEGAGQGFAQLSEEMFLGASGLRLRLHLGAGRAAPGSPLSAIGYAGETRVAGAALSHPLVRSRPLNLSLTAGLDAFESLVEARPFPGAGRERQSRDAVRALRLGVEGAVQDALLPFAPAAASTTGLLRLHRGIEALGASEGTARTARAGSEFGFTRLVAEATRQQPLAMPLPGWVLSVQGMAAAQWSGDVLPPAEKLYLGGNRLGRGFFAGQAAGDRALAGSAELQLSGLVEAGLPLGLQLYLFRDEGLAWDNRSPAAPEGLERRLASWGGGLRLQFEERAQLELEAVRRLTRRPEGAGLAPLAENALLTRLLLRF